LINPLTISNLSFKYPGSKDHILKGINMTVKEGEINAIVGLSGSGKSTLCHCISGIMPHVYKGEITGKVCLYGKPVKAMKLSQISQKLGIVFQNPDNQLFSFTVENEIAFGPENLCVPREEIGNRIENVLKMIQLEIHRHSSPNNLSGGQKQLVAIAAVLSLNPDILIFDEIMSQIDQEGKESIKKIVVELRNMGKTIIMVEHDFGNLDIADHIYAMKNGTLVEFEGCL
jgi:energy-coupling factor transport system ATP-binding protein